MSGTLRVRLRAVGLAALMCVTVVAASSTAGAVDAPVDQPSTGWTVVAEQLPDGTPAWRVTWQLDQQLASKSLPGVITADGRPVGSATVAPDLRSVSTITTNAAVTDDGVQLALTYGGLEYVAPPTTAQTPLAPDATAPGRPATPVLDVDPGSPGVFSVSTGAYNLGRRALTLPSLPRPVELAGRVYWAPDAPGRRPVVLFLHGAHHTCFRGDESLGGWPCPDGFRPIPSAAGYGRPARVLASHGYTVISIAANGVNAQDGALPDRGATARADLVLAHLDRWREWDQAPSEPWGDAFVGGLDFGNVGLMGHSRGGEGVVRAAVLNAARGRRFGIRAVLPLAPTNFNRQTLPGVAMSVVLPYCDGDVFDLPGQQYYDDARHALPGDPAAKSTVLVMGANHNYFNTEWTPGLSTAPSNDDWWASYEGHNRACDPAEPVRLTPAEQQAVGTAYIAGFFRLQLGRERALLGLLDGSGSRAASAGRADVRVVALSPQRISLAPLTRPSERVTTSGVTATWCTGGDFGWPPHLAPLPPCATNAASYQTPHWTVTATMPFTPTLRALALRWDELGGAVRVAPARRNLSAMHALTFRAGTDPSAGSADLRVQLVDAAGHRASVLVSDVSRALRRLPGDEAMLPRRILQQVSIPLNHFGEVDLTNVTAVRLIPASPTGRIWVTDLMAQRPSIGGNRNIPRLTVDNVRMTEGDTAPRAARFTVTASRTSTQPISAFTQATLMLVDDVGGTVDFAPYKTVRQRVVLPPGETSATVDVPLDPDLQDDDHLVFVLSLSRTHGALASRFLGRGTVLDDDPRPRLTITPAQDAESAPLTFHLQLSEPSGRMVHVRADVVGGTASAGHDYPDIPAFDGAVEPGQTEGVLVLYVFDDDAIEPDETVVLRPSTTTARYTGPELITGTILDDD